MTLSVNRTRLHDWLEAGTAFDPHYLPSRNSDHLPMTLCAMAGLGAGEAFLSAYRTDYARILRPVVASDIRLAHWQDGLGHPDAYGALLPSFRGSIADHGAEAVAAEVLPVVLPAMAMAAFHPLIRLAYGLDFGSDAEVAAGLAYLVSQHQSIPVSDAALDIGAVMRTQMETGPRTFGSERFADGIMELVADDAYPTGCAADLASCAAVALDVYRGTRNFFALHMVTATQAARVCSRLVGESLVLPSLTGALLAAHQVVGSPNYDNPLPPPEHLDREHAYKYAWVCASEYQHYGRDVYRAEAIAYRDAGLIAPWVEVG